MKKILILIILLLNISISANYNYIVRNMHINELLSQYTNIEPKYPKYNSISECELNITDEIYNELENTFSLNKTKEEWCSIEYLDLSNKNITFIPDIVQILPNLEIINASNNKIKTINLTSLRNIKSIDLENNEIEIVPNFHDNIEFINLKNNPIRTSSLSNVRKGHFNLSAQDFNPKLSSNSSFCIGLENGDITISGTLPVYICETNDFDPSEWLDFARINCSRNHETITQLENVTTAWSCHNKNINELPAPGLQKFGSINIYNNNLKNLDGFAFVRNFNVLNAYNNKIENIKGLSLVNNANTIRLDGNLLKSTEGLSGLTNFSSLNLQNNLLENLNGLENIVGLSSLDLRNNSTLQDISALANIRSGTIYLEDRHYGVKVPYDSEFCSRWTNSNLTVSGNPHIYKVCDVSPADKAKNAIEWLEFARDNCGNNFQTIGQLENTTSSWSCHNKNLENIPSEGITRFDRIRMENNKLTNVNGFGKVTQFNTLRLENNLLNDISGLSNLTTVSGYLYLDGNPDLQDLRPLSNLTRGQVRLDNRNYNFYPSNTSSFCTSNSVTVTGLDKSLICN